MNVTFVLQGLGITAFSLGISGIMNTTHLDKWKDMSNSDCVPESPTSWSNFEACFIVLSTICMVSLVIIAYLRPINCLLIPQHRFRGMTVPIVIGVLSLIAVVSIFHSTKNFSPRHSSDLVSAKSDEPQEEFAMFDFLEKKIAGCVQFLGAFAYVATVVAIVFEPEILPCHPRAIRRVQSWSWS